MTTQQKHRLAELSQLADDKSRQVAALQAANAPGSEIDRAAMEWDEAERAIRSFREELLQQVQERKHE